MRLVLIGDGESPHLLKWARGLVGAADVQVWVASSRGFLPGFNECVPVERRLSLSVGATRTGRKLGLLATVPKLARWLRQIDADWLHAHYLTSHGTLAWLAKRFWGLRAGIVGSAWGSDILLTPQRSIAYRWLTQRILRACILTTSDSIHMAQRMKELGAGEVMIFPFGLEVMPTEVGLKEPWLFFANRSLEPLYRPERVLAIFAGIAAVNPDARLIVANEGSAAPGLPAVARALGLNVGLIGAGHQVEFVGRLDAERQARAYARACWYVSLPTSDSVSVSVLEAMAHGCIPLLSDLPANRELVCDGVNGRILANGQEVDIAELKMILKYADRIGRENRAWIAAHGLFAPGVARFLVRLRELAVS
ncbi:glycosyltransferase [Variovorax guangxiensis]|uniref:Glycosyltransferase involved in cell wall biosynthesis n=1 Tax=Variovorax guangxiensis TaxID=1775474 RepID=A0A840FZP1_9BURK|nr:glycosyltransferase [Variovorax guangxiensis]MBB4222591.1 glycosyltransferase involved in cell wall biosynthesis [Variovorax guangxiensis]